MKNNRRLDQEASAAAREDAEREEQTFQEQIAADILNEDPADDDDDEDEDDDDYDDVKVQQKDVDPASEDYPKHQSNNLGVENPLSRTELLDWLHSFANSNDCPEDPKYDRIPFGMVGFPNVGKSSVINVLMGNTRNAHGVVRVGVASQPGKTKHFQTLLLPDRSDMLLCDCPGLVFPSFVNNTADLIAAGVYPIAQMRDWRSVTELLCQRIPREVLNAQYGIQIPMPTADAVLEASHKQQLDSKIPPPTAEEFLTSYCLARGMLAAASGVPDFQRASRIVIKEYADGKLVYCHPPPKYNAETFHKETMILALQKMKKLRDRLLQTSINNSNKVSQDNTTTTTNRRRPRIKKWTTMHCCWK